MKGRQFGGVVMSLMTACWLLADPAISFAQREAGPGEVIPISRVDDVIKLWQPERQLYVKGDIGVEPHLLKELAQWLRQHGPHWTVVLMNNAEGEFFRTADDRTYTGMDAVEHALGNALSNRTGFGLLENPVSHETDGAIFVLSLRERTFSYFGSEAQDRRNLGESHWVGNLDQRAFRAMRSGGRIIAAVKDTVSYINGALESRIQQEVSQALIEARERKKAMTAFRSDSQAMLQQVGDVEGMRAQFAKTFPQATGPLASPPIANWKERIAELEESLTEENVRGLEQQLKTVGDEIHRYQNAYSTSADFPSLVEGIRAEISTLASAPNDVARPKITLLNQTLEQAEKDHQSGGLGTSSLIADMEKMLGEGKKLVQQEEERLKQKAMIEGVIRWTVFAMLCLFGACILVYLTWLHRRRRPMMEQARKEFEERELSVRRATDGIDQLFQRNHEILGSHEQVVQRGYRGTTLELSEKTLRYIDDLLIMSKEVNRVVEEARVLVYPRSVWGRLINLFSGAGYNQAIEKLSGAPLKFNRRDGLPWVLREELASKLGWSEPIAESQLPDEINLSFDEVYQAFRRRGDATQQTLNTIEDSLIEVHDTLSRLQAEIGSMVQDERRLAQAAQNDGYFFLPQAIQQLIPSVQRDWALADQLSTFDAVQAMQGPIRLIERKISDWKKLVAILDSARSGLFVDLKKESDLLNASGYTSHWIDRDLDSITTRCDGLTALAVEQAIGEELDQIQKALGTLSDTAHRAAALAKTLEETHRPEVTQLEADIEKTRGILSQAMSLSPETLLKEVDRDPTLHAQRAKSNLEAARSMVIQGHVTAAEEAIASMQQEIAQTRWILDESKRSVDQFDDRLAQQRGSLDRLERSIEQGRKKMETARSRYMLAALVLDDRRPQPIAGEETNGDQSPPSSTEHTEDATGLERPRRSVSEWVQETVSLVPQIERLLEHATQAHRQGHILKGAEGLRKAEAFLNEGHAILQAVQAHLEKLDQQSQLNRQLLERLEVIASELDLARSEPLVTEKTIQAIASGREQVRVRRHAMDAVKNMAHPFESAKDLAALEGQLKELSAQIVADRKGHAEATRAVLGAEKQLAIAKEHVERSQKDGITDSPKIIALNRSIADYHSRLSDVRQQLSLPHGDWERVDEAASRYQSEISRASDELNRELAVAQQALQAFQDASRVVFQAEQWSGAWGIRVAGSPGVQELELARANLHRGLYQEVLATSHRARTAAQDGVQQAEREVARRNLEAAIAAEQLRRAAEAARQASYRRSTNWGGVSHRGGGGSFGSSSSPSSYSGGGGSGSGGGGSGFSRSGW